MGACNPEEGIWHETLRAHSYDVDFRKRATGQAICSWFLEAAWNHAEQLGFGYRKLAEAGLLWVLSRLAIEIDCLPEWGEPIQLSTWPRGTNGALALRDFELTTAAGKRLVAGASSWLVLDASSHRPQRIDKLPFRVPDSVTRAAIGRQARKLGACKSETSAARTRAQYSDIDINNHVNSARYIGWLLDSYPAEFVRSYSLRVMELNYVGETKWNDEVSVHSEQRGETEFCHSITKQDLSEVCRGEMRWARDGVKA